ncbi:nucleotidyltransferase family protein [Vibrio alfacsensis]|uniref:nucleotidyltransferase family protein n=1 Tax=Vibrio alfacsensis TaxID=1074311 RepID=UPI0040696E4C
MANIDDITAIVLCGGLGTRLRSISGDLPKPMVDVAGRPFLEYILDDLIQQGVSKAILAVSYKKNTIIEHFGTQYKSLRIRYSIEIFPLGTGGAIKQALEQHFDTPAQVGVVINGDSFVEYNLSEMYEQQLKTNADLSIVLVNRSDACRYGLVRTDNGRVVSFNEKQSDGSGLINAGIYLISVQLMHNFPSKMTFSFETDVLKKLVQTHHILPYISEGYFIDIGIPEDYQKAQMDLLNFH